jgi:hypothetical protein
MVSWTVPAPGGMEQDFFVVVDGGDGAVSECNEANNTATTATVSCPQPG